jgi:hypothetical protein
MSAIFYDTEFIEDGRTIDLISIGMVRESDGAELYLVNADMPAKRIRRSPWLMENVVPHLPRAYGDWRNHMPKRWLFNYYDGCVLPHREIATAVERFILQDPDPELWAWYGAYDHVVLCQLWGAMVDLPDGVPMWTNDVQQEWLRLGKPDLPESDQTEHHALADARHCRRLAEFLRAFEGQS